MVILASFGYGLGSWFLKRRLHGRAARRAGRGHDDRERPDDGAAAACIDLPAYGRLRARLRWPPWWRSGVLGTGVSFVIFFSLIASEGPARASLVAYVAPGFSVDLRRLDPRRELHPRHRGRAGADRRRLLARGRGPPALAAAASAGARTAGPARARCCGGCHDQRRLETPSHRQRRPLAANSSLPGPLGPGLSRQSPGARQPPGREKRGGRRLPAPSDTGAAAQAS